MKVSAIVIAYNHGRFLEEAIRGVLMQETDFPCELVIADDCSTDGTRDVIRHYWEQHRGRIRVLLNRRNVGARRTMIRAYEACRGQYVAMLDGDDYWTSPHKLQRQADLLDRHPDYALCFHSVGMVWDDAREPRTYRPRRISETYVLEDLLEYNFIASCSPMYRRGMFGRHPQWCFRMPVYDWTQHILHAQYGLIGYIDEPMGVYRQHSGGVYSTGGVIRKLKVAIGMLKRFRCVLAREHWNAINASLYGHYCRLAHRYCDAGRLVDARRCIRECLLEVGLHREVPVCDLLSAALRARAPDLHRRCKRMFAASRRAWATSCKRRGDACDGSAGASDAGM